MDDIGADLAAIGRVLRLETRGRRSGTVRVAHVGYVEGPDGSVLVAAGAPDADWAANLDADPACRVTIGDDAWDAVAEPLDDRDAAAAVAALILRYGTPAERLGRGPAYRLRRTTGRSR